jgi:hypothetical protein
VGSAELTFDDSCDANRDESGSLNHHRYGLKLHLSCLVTAPARSWQCEGRLPVSCRGTRRCVGTMLSRRCHSSETGRGCCTCGVRFWERIWERNAAPLPR